MTKLDIQILLQIMKSAINFTKLVFNKQNYVRRMALSHCYLVQADHTIRKSFKTKQDFILT